MNFLTVGDIAQRLKVDRDEVSYAVRKANIEPVGRAGIVRLFSGSAVGTVKKFINSKRQSRKAVARCTS